MKAKNKKETSDNRLRSFGFYEKIIILLCRRHIIC